MSMNRPAPEMTAEEVMAALEEAMLLAQIQPTVEAAVKAMPSTAQMVAQFKAQHPKATDVKVNVSITGACLDHLHIQTCLDGRPASPKAHAHSQGMLFAQAPAAQATPTAPAATAEAPKPASPKK